MGSRRSEKKSARAADKEATSAQKAAAKAAKAESTAAKAADKAAKSEAKAAKSQAKAAKNEAKAAKAARVLTDPKAAKRVVTVGKILAPALAPVLVKAAVSARTTLDTARARSLGVPVSEVAAYRGPTGKAGARISGLTDAVRELGARPGGDLQIVRFVEVADRRLKDLTAVVQASATMPRARRTEVLRAVDRELDTIDADLVSHLMNRGRR